jgi:signal recognition particle GTPase
MNSKDVIEEIENYFIDYDILDYATEEEIKSVAHEVAKKAYDTAIQNGITFSEDDYELLSEELGNRFYQEFIRELNKVVLANRKRTINAWKDKLVEQLDKMVSELNEKDLIKDEGSLEELFYCLVEDAEEKAI